MLKKANNNELFERLVQAANATQPKKETDSNAFTEYVKGIIKQGSKKHTLLDLAKKAQQIQDDPMASAELAPADAAPVDALPAEGQEAPPVEEPQANEEVKQKLVEALIALCGGTEEAKACIDTCCGEAGAEQPIAEEPVGELGGEPVEEPMPEAGPVDMPKEMGMM